MERAAEGMRPYLTELRRLLPRGLPLYVAALGPLMLGVAAEMAEGISLNWCSEDRVGWSRQRVESAAAEAGRPVPLISEYIRTAVDPDPAAARAALWQAAQGYALGPVAYRRHFERMGFGEELAGIEAGRTEPSDALLSASGAHGRPGEVRSQFGRLAKGLDVAIVRILVSSPGDLGSAQRVLEECRPL
jgi:alkanesulfonate monooxygenase SsuD/methylene tetrahydromethanopterin reductase-like flavin-dependent oxidoreductase (luciferase family)